MFSKRKMITSTKASSDNIHQLKTLLHEAEAVMIGAGAGLSTAAGFYYTGKRFTDNFSDFIEKYGFHDMYAGGFYPFASLEEYWAYWSRYIFINRYQDKDNGTYARLFDLVKDKDYFVLTTNVDHQFQKAGFDHQRLFYTQGDYGLFQCSEPCHQKTYDNETIVRAMIAQQKEMKIPGSLIPHCPICGKVMSMNLRADHTFVQDEGWYRANKRYSDFLCRHQGQKILFLELGVGMNTPGIVKFPFWKMVQQNPQAAYVCINQNEAYAPREIMDRSICINADIGNILEQL